VAIRSKITKCARFLIIFIMISHNIHTYLQHVNCNGDKTSTDFCVW